MRLNEGPLFFCSFTDIAANAKKPNDMDFPSQGGTLHGAGLFAALSYDEGKTWPYKRLVTPGGPEGAEEAQGTDTFFSQRNHVILTYLSKFSKFDPSLPHPHGVSVFGRRGGFFPMQAPDRF